MPEAPDDPVAFHLQELINTLLDTAAAHARMGGTPARFMALGIAAGAIAAARDRWIADRGAPPPAEKTSLQ